MVRYVSRWSGRRSAFLLLPDAISAADGAMLEPLGVAIHAVDLGHTAVGMRVGVFGCGPIGLLILQLAGAGWELRAARNRTAAPPPRGGTCLWGDQVSIWSANPRNWQRPGRGVDVAFEVAGENAAVETAMTAVKPGGAVILVGIPADDRTSFRPPSPGAKGLTIKWSAG